MMVVIVYGFGKDKSMRSVASCNTRDLCAGIFEIVKYPVP
jgi:hypothetical protein